MMGSDNRVLRKWEVEEIGLFNGKQMDKRIIMKFNWKF